MKQFILILVTLLFVSGCAVDDRVKRASTVLNAKTQVASNELDKADTPEAKVKVAEDYFKTAPAMTQVLQDYLTGTDPKKPVIKKDPASMVDMDLTP